MTDWLLKRPTHTFTTKGDFVFCRSYYFRIWNHRLRPVFLTKKQHRLQTLTEIHDRITTSCVITNCLDSITIIYWNVCSVYNWSLLQLGWGYNWRRTMSHKTDKFLLINHVVIFKVAKSNVQLIWFNFTTLPTP